MEEAGSPAPGEERDSSEGSTLTADGAADGAAEGATDGRAFGPSEDGAAPPGAAAGSSDGRRRALETVPFEDLVREQIRRLGADLGRDSLRDTPRRVRESLEWLTRGYRSTVEEAIDGAVFDEEHDSMVLVKDIEVYSLCEHHMLPFFGKAHVAYIPDGRIVGLSKLPRVVEVFARRLQIQERLTEEIAGAIQDALAPRGVGVVVEAYHLCMMMRGVEKQNSKTITSAVRGTFRSDPRTREEFLRLVLSPEFIS